jgi:TPR repeat protein
MAAEKGHKEAQSYLSVMYGSGVGVAKSQTKYWKQKSEK